MATNDSIHYQIRKDIQSILKGAELLSMPQDNILVRMLPVASEQLPKLPAIIIAPYGSTDWKPDSFANSTDNIYFVEICLVAANNLDMATKDNLYQGWHEKARKAIMYDDSGINFRIGLPNVPTVWNIDAVESPTYDRTKLQQLYAYQSIVLKFHSHETGN